MAIFLIRVGLAVGIVLLAVQWPLPALLGFWVLLVWLLPRAWRDDREARRLRMVAGPAVAQITDLERHLAAVCAYSMSLEQQVEKLQETVSRHDRATDESGGHPLYRKVGLHQQAPKWLIEVVRREFRKRLHPDTKPAHQKAEAERRFVEMEAVVREIWQQRGF